MVNIHDEDSRRCSDLKTIELNINEIYSTDIR